MLNVRAIWLVLVVFSFSAGAAPIDDADAALMRGEYESAVATLTALAKGGDAVAMVRLASLYHRGEGVTRNVEKAVDLYLSSAELGNADVEDVTLCTLPSLVQLLHFCHRSLLLQPFLHCSLC